MATLGERIKAERLARNWSIAQLAAALGCSNGAVQGWENANRTPRHQVLFKLKELFGYDLAMSRTKLPEPGSKLPKLAIIEKTVFEIEPLEVPTDAARRILKGRVERGWSQNDLANHAGVGASSVSQWENRHPISKESYEKIVKAFENHPVDESKIKADEDEDDEYYGEKQLDADTELDILIDDTKHLENEILKAIRMAHESGDPAWCIVILPQEEEGLDIRVCARPAHRKRA